MKPRSTKLKVVKPRNGQSPAGIFSAQAFLDSAGVSKRIVQYKRDETIFTQGDVCVDVMYSPLRRREAVGAVDRRQRGRGRHARPG